MEAQKTMAAFVAEHGITIKSVPTERADSWGENDGYGMDHWAVTLCRPGREMKTVYSMGYGHRVWRKDARSVVNHDPASVYILPETIKPGQRVTAPWNLTEKGRRDWRDAAKFASTPTPPTAEDVLNSLAMDSSSYDNAEDFASWCAEFGSDPDSIKAERSYNECGRLAKKLRHFLGDDAYRELTQGGVESL